MNMSISCSHIAADLATEIEAYLSYASAYGKESVLFPDSICTNSMHYSWMQRHYHAIRRLCHVIFVDETELISIAKSVQRAKKPFSVLFSVLWHYLDKREYERRYGNV